MKKLFIIGNGFDLSHGLKTSYNDFRKYLKMGCNGICHYKPNVSPYSYGALVANRELFLLFILKLFNDYYNDKNWGDIEAALPNIVYRLQFSEEEHIDGMSIDEDDIAMERAIDAMKKRISNLSICISKFRELIDEWIQTIDTSNVCGKKKYSAIMNEEDLYLTFNYTDTLEKAYRINPKNICHIHGIRGRDIVFGHGEDESLFDLEYNDNALLIADTFNSIFEELKKNVYECRNRHCSFFYNSLDTEIKHIYSIGFSFADIDLEYIREICNNMNTLDVVWHLTKFDESVGNVERFKKTIRDCGFFGKFGKLI